MTEPTRITDPAQRRRILKALTSGALIGGIWPQAAAANWWGVRPRPLPPERSIHSLRGQVLVNGRPASLAQRIEAADTLEVGPGGQAIFAVGDNAFILRERSILELSGKQLFLGAMRLVQGAVLGVFGRRDTPLELSTRSATIGIRGTALYTALHPGMTYACTCYGHTELSATQAPEQREQIRSTHHDAPRWILEKPADGLHIRPAPMRDHTDMELLLIEALCGRELPFPLPARRPGRPGDSY